VFALADATGVEDEVEFVVEGSSVGVCDWIIVDALG
jgi:hypothetical protein